MGKYKLSDILLLLVIMVLLHNPQIGEAKKADEVILQLRWHHQFQFAGYYAADWMGYYEDEGLIVEIRPGCTDESEVLDVTKEVSEGKVDFGIGATDILLSQDKGEDLCVISSVLQRSGINYFIGEGTIFNSPIDIVELNIGRRENDLLDIELQAMVINEGIGLNSLTPEINENEKFKVQDIVEKKYDIVPGYSGGIIEYYARKDEIKLKTIRPIDYGIDFYGDTLFTRKDFAMKNPELVERFRRASMKGWQYALENPDEIIEIMDKEFSNPELKSEKDFIEYNKFQAEKIKERTLYPIVELGNINQYRWKDMHENLMKLELIHNPINLEEFIFDYENIILERNKVATKRIIKSLFLILALVIVFFIINISKKNKRLKKELEENKRKEALIIHQARHAAMGEMIGNIAHQWRQPLNNLNLILSNMQDSYDYDDLDSEYLNSSIERSHLLIMQMSQTIDDFRNFLKPGNEKENFYILDSVKLALNILEENIRFQNIKLILEENNILLGYGYKNQCSQVIFNIVNNSIDALSKSNRNNKIIRILIYEAEGMSICEIIDNAGGINDEVSEKIFNPYFTTKTTSKGTGLGLYMSKTIINNMGGKIRWKNTKEGVSMSLIIPKGRSGHGGNKI